jgi:hypothetical protein
MMTTTPITWNDLGWVRVAADTLNSASPPLPAFFNLLAADLGQWGRGGHSCVLFQRPVMIAVHVAKYWKLNA